MSSRAVSDTSTSTAPARRGGEKRSSTQGSSRSRVVYPSAALFTLQRGEKLCFVTSDYSGRNIVDLIESTCLTKARPPGREGGCRRARTPRLSRQTETLGSVSCRCRQRLRVDASTWETGGFRVETFLGWILSAALVMACALSGLAQPYVMDADTVGRYGGEIRVAALK